MQTTSSAMQIGSDYLARARSAHALGDFDESLKLLNCSRSYYPFAEGLVLELECRIAKGCFEELSKDVDKIVERFQQLPEHNAFAERMDRALAIVRGAELSEERLPLNHFIEIWLPVCFESDSALSRVLVDPSFGNITDLQTLSNKGGKAVYDIGLLPANPELADLMIRQTNKRLSADQKRRLKKHTHIISLLGPSEVLACNVESQLDLVSDVLRTISAMVVQVDAPAVYVCNAGTTRSPQEWQNLCNENSLESSITALVTMMNDDDNETFHTCGMHGFALPEAAFRVFSDDVNLVPAMLEFLELSVINELTPSSDGLEYHSAVLGRDVIAEWTDECMYDDGYFHNQFGTWILEVV